MGWRDRDGWLVLVFWLKEFAGFRGSAPRWGVTKDQRHLLVDGNNVGRAWGHTGKLWRKDPNAARAQVVEMVRVWHDVMEWRVSVIFDGRGETVSLEHPTDEKTFSVAYSPSGMTADS